jgi:hypothetical protein
MVLFLPGNHPPAKPTKPVGLLSGKIGSPLIYSTSTTDFNGDQIYYLFDWGDGSDSDWLGPINTGEICERKHVWTVKGDYEIRAKAKDTNDAESEWSDPLKISMPRNIISYNTFLQRFLTNHLKHFTFLQKLLNKFEQ